MARHPRRELARARLARCALFLSALCWHAPALAAPPSAAEPAGRCADANPWSRLPSTGAALVGPTPLLLSFGAAAAPVALGPSGIDHGLRVVSQTRLGGSYAPEPVSVLAPFVMAGGLVVGFGLSTAFGACSFRKPQAAMLQAVVLTAATTSVLKLATGRSWPNGGRDPHAVDRLDHPEDATRFRPWREGLAAWPSGHTAVMVAAASALRTSSPQLGALRWLGYPLAGGVAAGMWLGDHHWGSDILSGALLGEAIGGAVGAGFSGEGEPQNLSLVPQQGGWLLVYATAW